MKQLTKLFILSITCLISLLGIAACSSSDNEQIKKIGIVVPLENKALDEMVAGFSETLSAQTKTPIKIKVVNAQGDMNLQRSMIQQMKDEHYSLIVPIGTVATQMTAATITNQHIVSLAANFAEQERKARKNCNITVVHDEISPKEIIQFIHQTYPDLKHLTLIHSTSDKIFPDVKTAVLAGKAIGIEIKPLMISTLNELYSVANALPDNTQGILILKDIMIASGISTLKMTAEKHHIPLIASDQGSVQEGALFAVGVHEREIGVDGANLAKEILAGKSDCSLPIVEMTKLTVFVNPSTLQAQHQSIDNIQQAANQFHYKIELTGGQKNV